MFCGKKINETYFSYRSKKAKINKNIKYVLKYVCVEVISDGEKSYFSRSERKPIQNKRMQNK